MDTLSPLHIATLGKPHGIKGAICVQSKTQPGSLVFECPLFYLKDNQLSVFEVTDFEIHHTKIVCRSPLMIDRTGAQQFANTLLYTHRISFFEAYPDQLFDNLCQDYQVINQQGQYIGQLQYIEDIHHIPMGRVIDQDQVFNLPMQILQVNHLEKIIQLDYIPYDY